MPSATTDRRTLSPQARRALAPAIGVAASAFLLFGLMLPGWGHALLAASVLGAWLAGREPGRDLTLIGIGLAIVSTTSVEADVEWRRFFAIGTALTLALLVPYLVDRTVFRREAYTFPWRTGRSWPRAEKAYLVAVPLLGWLVLPFYFVTSGAYRNWPHITTASELGRFFVGVNFVGTWDELFFVCTCFALLRRHFPVWLANLLQAVIFTSFLWELGYREWGPFLTGPFALLQGWIFTRTGSLAYVVIVHLLFDAIVLLSIVHAHNPGLLPIFLV